MANNKEPVSSSFGYGTYYSLPKKKSFFVTTAPIKLKLDFHKGKRCDDPALMLSGHSVNSAEKQQWTSESSETRASLCRREAPDILSPNAATMMRLQLSAMSLKGRKLASKTVNA